MYSSVNVGCQCKSGPGKIHEVILVWNPCARAKLHQQKRALNWRRYNISSGCCLWTLHDHKTLGDKNWDEFTKLFLNKNSRGLVWVFVTPPWISLRKNCEPQEPWDKVPVLYVILRGQYYCFCLQCAGVLFAVCISFVCSMHVFFYSFIFVCSVQEMLFWRVIRCLLSEPHVQDCFKLCQKLHFILLIKIL